MPFVPVLSNSVELKIMLRNFYDLTDRNFGRCLNTFQMECFEGKNQIDLCCRKVYENI
jgi:hypothetical protein